MFCSKCGKEIADDAQFCQFCGNELTQNVEQKEENKVDLSVHKPKQNENGIGFLPIFGIVIILFFMFIMIGLNNSDKNTQPVTTNNFVCPSITEMKEAIELYNKGNIIYKFTPELNKVTISYLAEQQLMADDLKTLGYITACYSGHFKGNNLYWVDIYSAKTNKKIAKYSDSWGFKMVE